jgi:hypothetical protein
MYTARQEMLRKIRDDKANDFANTTNNNVGQANENIRMKQETESNIKKLEEMENNLLSQMQQTMAKK